MTQIDEFESLFKSADKPVFHIEAVKIQQILIITDENVKDVEAYVARLKRFLAILDSEESPLQFDVITGEEFGGVKELLSRINEKRPDLVCTYRNLHISAEEHPFSLGVYVDVLTQATHTPILLVPRPEQMTDVMLQDTDHVMAVTDHLAGDRHLVTYATRFTKPGGKLSLVHIEDQQVFERYIGVIGKIPEIDTDVARELILAKLLREPTDYIETCRTEIEKLNLPISVEPVVTIGHRLSDYKALIEEHGIDLLVINTKDDDQMAMHGMGYPLSIEIQNIPLLMI